MITTLIVDWGGVLNLGGHASVMSRDIQRKYNSPYMEIIKVIVPLWKKLNRNLISFEDLLHDLNKKLDLDISTNELEEFLGNSFNLNVELIDLLKLLKKKYSLIMLSNNNDPLVDAIKKKHLEIFNLFEKHYFSSELNMRKPDPEIFKHLLDNTGLEAKECLLIDDTDENIIVAREIGMGGILFENTKQFKKDLASFGIKVS